MPENIRLINVYGSRRAWKFLYDLLAERPPAHWISTEGIPPIESHKRFVKAKPYRFWYLILYDTAPIGELHVTYLNEIGISIFKQQQGKGFGTEAIRLFLKTHEPLPAIPSKRNGHWLANIAITNEESKKFFGKQGFRPLQETWVLDGE